MESICPLIFLIENELLEVWEWFCKKRLHYIEYSDIIITRFTRFTRFTKLTKITKITMNHAWLKRRNFYENNINNGNNY